MRETVMSVQRRWRDASRGHRWPTSGRPSTVKTFDVRSGSGTGEMLVRPRHGDRACLPGDRRRTRSGCSTTARHSRSTIEADGGRTSAVAAGLAAAPMPATVVSVNVAARRRVTKGDDPDRPRSDEDGAAGPRARGRRRRGHALSSGRSGAAGLPLIESRMNRSRSRRHRGSRPARRAAERVRGDLDRRQDRVRRSPERGRTPHDRSVGLRQPEVGAPDGRCRRGFRRHQAATGTRYTALVPNLAGLARAVEAKVDEVAVFAVGLRDRSAAGTSIRPSTTRSRPTTRSCAARRSSACRCAAYVSTAFGCPFEGARLPRSRGARGGALFDMGAYEVAVSDTIGVAHPGQVPIVVGAVAAARAARPDRAAFSRHAGDGARQRARRAGSRRRDVRCLSRRPGRVSVCAGRDRQPRDRGSALHARWARDRDRRQPRPDVGRSRFIEARIGHPLASRYAAAVKR